jgi:phosphoglycolate phosphatase
MIKAVGIDLDDTLCLTEATCFAIENEALVAIGQAPMSREIHQKTWGKPLFEIIGSRSPGVDVSAFRRAYTPIMDMYVRDGKYDSIPAQNLQALDALLAQGRQLFILTSREQSELPHLLEPGHELARRIDFFYHRDNLAFHKPDPRAFDLFLKEHTVQPHECVYVGDSLTDVAAATQAGLHFVASLESGLRTRQDFAGYAVDYFINNFPELVEAVKHLDQMTTDVL